MKPVVTCAAALAATLLLCAASAQAQTPKKARAAPEDIFKTIDRNGNGCIDMEEGRNYASRRFHALDKNGDGSLDATEAPLRAGESASDRPINVDEWQDAYSAHFNAVDTDGNHCLDQKEVDAARAATLSGGQ